MLTAEPGAGKTGSLANLAAAHPQRARSFIRRDSAATVTGGDARSFPLAVGHQPAWQHPELFHRARAFGATALASLARSPR